MTAKRVGAIEVTQVDFTKTKNIMSSDLSVFGVMLGDHADVSVKKFERLGLDSYDDDVPHGEWSVFDGKQQLLGITSHDDRIVRIVLFADMAMRLVGDSRKLFAPDITGMDAPTRLHLLGREDRRSVEPYPDAKVKNLMSVTCTYDREGIRLIQVFSQFGALSPAIQFVQPAKRRP